MTEEELALPKEARNKKCLAIRAKIANYEANRTRIPLSFLKRVGEALGLPENWHQRAAATRERTAGRSYRPASAVLPVFAPRAPQHSGTSLRSLWLMDTNSFKPPMQFPHYFGIDLPEQSESDYPALLGHEFEDDAWAPAFPKGSRAAFRTDLTPIVPLAVAATGKKGERLWGVLAVGEGGTVLRDINGRKPDVPIEDLLAVEGLVIGREIRYGDDDVDVAYSRRGLSAERLRR